MNTLFDEEIRGHHQMRDRVLTLVSDADLAASMPGSNPTLGELLIEMGNQQSVYTHSFDSSAMDWSHREIPEPTPTVAALRAWFEAQDGAMRTALERYDDAGLKEERIDRGGGFIVSPFVQHEIYREAVYISYGKLSVYLRALERDPGDDWASWIG